MNRGHYKPGALRRREDGRYCFDVRIGGKRYIRIMGEDRLTAQRALDRLRHEKGEAAVAERNGVPLPDKKDERSFAKVADEFLESCRGSRSEGCYHDSFKHLRRLLGQLSFHDLQPADIERYKRTRQGETRPADMNGSERPYSLASIQCELSALKLMLRSRKELGLWNPFQSADVKMFPAKKAGKKRMRILSPEEEIRLLAAANPRLRNLIHTALWSGMRIHEILNLRWSSINLKGRNPQIVLEDAETKTDEGRRIPIIPELAEVLKAQPVTTEFVFVNPETGKPFTGVDRGWKAARAAAGIKGLRFHDLRHTFATRALRPPVSLDIVTVSKILGHASIAMTERYITPYPDDTAERMQGLVFLERKAEGAETARPASIVNSALYN